MKKVDKLSIREAVKHFDVSRPTLQKALKSGKISGVQDGQGTWTIDPSEMARVYQPRQDEVVKAGGQEHEKLSTKNTPLHGQVETLKEQLGMLKNAQQWPRHWQRNGESTLRTCAGCCPRQMPPLLAEIGGRGGDNRASKPATIATPIRRRGW